MFKYFAAVLIGLVLAVLLALTIQAKATFEHNERLLLCQLDPNCYTPKS